MLCGRRHPELGGDPKYLDVIGVNYYVDNQWLFPGSLASDTTIDRTHPLYRPVWEMLQEVYERYGRPLFIAETGIEDDLRPSWLRSICEEVQEALRAGVPIAGICLYPILNHPGWEDDRHCHNGLWDYANEAGERTIYEPLAQELRHQQKLFERREDMERARRAEPDAEQDPGDAHPLGERDEGDEQAEEGAEERPFRRLDRAGRGPRHRESSTHRLREGQRGATRRTLRRAGRPV